MYPSQEKIESRVRAFFIEHPHKCYNPAQIRKNLGAYGQEAARFVDAAIYKLLERGFLEQTDDYRYRLRVERRYAEGILQSTQGGVWSVTLDDGTSIELDSTEVKAFAGDRVKVALKSKSRASFVETIAFARPEFVAVVVRGEGRTLLAPQDQRIKTECVPLWGHGPRPQKGEKVLARIVRWKGERPEAEVVKVIGPAGDHEVEMHAIVLEFGLPTEFSPAALAEAEAISAAIPTEEIARRADFRRILTFTIDPEDAKDFDDALSLQILPTGNYVVGVHIADVTHYVREGSALDAEAYERGTSVYLVDRTLPMLPERLSNDLCSLKPDEDRLCFSAVFELTPQAEMVREWFGRTVIRSRRRFTYEEAQQILETGQGDHARALSILNDLARKLRQKRFQEGSINFETEEVKFKLDEWGRPLHAYTKVRKDAHKLIEDFMLLANRRVAQFIGSAGTGMYRVHPIPETEKLSNLRAFVKHFGYDFEIRDPPATARSLNRLASAVEGKPEQNIIYSAAIRSMPKAFYTPENIGHFALGFEFYTHFTSPIRRYPDVCVHRLLERKLAGRPYPPQERLYREAKHCSEREKRAADAERASVKYKQIEFLSYLGSGNYIGMVSGATDWGIYVELLENRCEGMIPLRDMVDDVYYLDESKWQITGKRTKKTFRLGDLVEVQIKKVNLLRRQADFRLVRKIG
ncbi:MAG: ribonuclease R [Bacteroidia bacterium]|nr:ribonuclease R [Bacteroidia bacterium]MDW8333045.1 ribonuclease R [Bacteroidia bacterium]